MRTLIAALAFALACALIAGCGGGGGGVVTSNGGGGQQIANPGANAATLVVDAGPVGVADVDTPFVTLTICVPGTSTCQTIDHIEVDTQSSGLRILAQALTISLPQANDSASGQPLAECMQFVDGNSWGVVATADMQVAGESATSLPVQVIGDPSIQGESGFPAVPTGCSSNVTMEDTVSAFGANGLLGVSPFVHDCGSACAQTSQYDIYYTCPSAGSCVPALAPLSEQVLNPVPEFPTDNNGVIVEMPAVPVDGAVSAAGVLVFGIGTEGNNGMAGATVLTADPSTGYAATQFNGTSLNAYFDTGSNAYYFADSSIPTCASSTSAPGFFCPTSPVNLTATNSGVVANTGQSNGITSTVTFQIGNAVSLITNNPTYNAFDNLGAPNSDTTTFDFGMPFFFGRNVYIAINGANTPGGMGPYYAY